MGLNDSPYRVVNQEIVTATKFFACMRKIIINFSFLDEKAMDMSSFTEMGRPSYLDVKAKKYQRLSLYSGNRSNIEVTLPTGESPKSAQFFNISSHFSPYAQFELCKGDQKVNVNELFRQQNFRNVIEYYAIFQYCAQISFSINIECPIRLSSRESE